MSVSVMLTALAVNLSIQSVIALIYSLMSRTILRVICILYNIKINNIDIIYK